MNRKGTTEVKQKSKSCIGSITQDTKERNSIGRVKKISGETQDHMLGQTVFLHDPNTQLKPYHPLARSMPSLTSILERD